MQPAETLAERLQRHARETPDHDAIVTPNLRLSYSALLSAVNRQIEKLEATGLSETSAIGILCADDVQHLILCIAIAKMGATSCTLATHESSASRNATIDYCEISDVVDHSHAIDPLANSDHTVPTTAANKHAEILFSTSGTSGQAKVVVHRDTDLVAQAHRHLQSSAERFACLATMEHNFVKRHRLYCVAVGATNVFLDGERESLVTACIALEANVLHVSAFQARELLALGDIAKLSNIRLKLGGSHVDDALRKRLRDEISTNVQAGYGTTETGAIAFTDPTDADAGESVGRPLPGIEVRILGADGTPLPAGERGEIAIRAKGMFRRYLGRPKLTETHLRGDCFHTGDIGFLDNANRIHLCGRADDMFVFNSMNIYPQDLESRICRYPGVIDAAVLPMPSDTYDNIPVALVAWDDKITPDSEGLEAYVREHVGVRSPRRFTRVEQIPRNAAGKIIRQDTLALFKRGDQIRTDVAAVVRNHEDNRVKAATLNAFVKNQTDIRLRDLGLDSLGRLDLMIMLEMDYDALTTPEQFAAFDTLNEICAWAVSPKPVIAEETGACTTRKTSVRPIDQADDVYLLRFFRRILHHCRAVSQFYKALSTLEHRLTPKEVWDLEQAHRQGRLVPADTPPKFTAALDRWFAVITRMMNDSGKSEPEQFSACRIRPTLTHFVGNGAPSEKTLIVCFPGRGDRKMLMPNAVLLQHTNASEYDLLMVTEPLRQGYRHGVPTLGNSLPAVIDWLGALEPLQQYRAIRTIGCSAGGYAAIVAAYQLGAELGVSVGGRFHSERYPVRIAERLWTTWKAVRRGDPTRTLLSYAADKTRDKTFARAIRWITGGDLHSVSFPDGEVGHLILRRLAERGDLAPYLSRTIFRA